MKESSAIFLVLCVVSGSLSMPQPAFLEYKDSQGQYSFGYNAPDSARSEVRSLDGSTRGSYSYVDDSGVIQSARYTADGENGFQVSASNLPRAPSPVMDTPEVAAARLDHLKALEDATKSAEGASEEDTQTEVKIEGKNIDTVKVESTAHLVENEMAGQAKGSAEMHIEMSGKEKKAVASDKKVELMEAGMEKAAQGGATQPIQSESRAAVQSNVPVTTSSFVIPGVVNLHNRIEHEQPDVPAVRSVSKSSAMPTSQPSMLQDPNVEPLMMNPAGTKLTMINSSERQGTVPMKIARLVGEPVSLNSYKPLSYSVPFLHGVIAPPNIVAVPYVVGASPIYSQRSPYQLILYNAANFE